VHSFGVRVQLDCKGARAKVKGHTCVFGGAFTCGGCKLRQGGAHTSWLGALFQLGDFVEARGALRVKGTSFHACGNQEGAQVII